MDTIICPMNPKWISTRLIYQSSYFTFHRVFFQDQRGKKRMWETVGRKRDSPVVVIFAVTDKNELILEKQYRPPLNAYVLELPAGLREQQDKSYHQAAQRELLEETGYHAHHVIRKGIFPLSAGMSQDLIHLFFATKLVHTKKQPDAGEYIQVLRVPLTKMTSYLTEQRRSKVLIDPYIYVGIKLFDFLL